VYPFQETMLSPTNEIKARAKLAINAVSLLLILLPFVLFRKHSGLVRHNLCGARRRVKWHVRKCTGRWAFLHRKSRLRRSLIPKFFVRGGPLALVPLWLHPQLISWIFDDIGLRLIFHDIGLRPSTCLPREGYRNCPMIFKMVKTY
jgi:hypothetical protein